MLDNPYKHFSYLQTVNGVYPKERFTRHLTNISNCDILNHSIDFLCIDI